MHRHFSSIRPNQVRVADISYVATWTGFAYLAFVIRLAQAGVTDSVGTVGDSHDNMIALYKTELIRRQGPWRNIEAVDFVTLDCFNRRRLLGPLGHVPPAEFEEAYYQQRQCPAMRTALA